VSQLKSVAWLGVGTFIEGQLQFALRTPYGWLRRFAPTYRCNAENQASHAGILGLCRISVAMGRRSNHARLRLLDEHLPFRRRHVNQHVAVKQPAPGTLRNPRHVEGLPR